MSGASRRGRSLRTTREIGIDRALGLRLHEARIRAGLSMVKLGATVGLTFQQIQKYEEGDNRIPIARLLDFAKTLNVTPAAFIEDLVSADGTALPPALTRLELDLLAAARRNPASNVRGYTLFLNLIADGVAAEIAHRLRLAGQPVGATARGMLAETPPADLLRSGPIELSFEHGLGLGEEAA